MSPQDLKVTFNCVVASAAVVLSACAAMIRQQEMHDARVASGRAPVNQSFAQQDGYAAVEHDALSVLKTQKSKFCIEPDDFMTPQGTDATAMNHRRQEREMLQGWMTEGKAPQDRYYLPLVVHPVGAGEDAYLSVPLAERDELRRNLQEDNFACFWTEGMSEQLPNNPSTNSSVLHIRASKWDGVLKPHAAAATTTAAEATRCPGAGTEVPFGKLLNKAFASDYVGCDVTTTALLWSPDPGPLANFVSSDGTAVMFQVSDPAVGEGSYVLVQVPKGASDAVFQSAKGDSLIIRGGTAKLNSPGDVYYLDALSVAKKPLAEEPPNN